MPDRPVNFSAGPAILPLPVLEQAARDVVALEGVGLSILEISHRSAPFERIIAETEASLRRLLGVPDTHAVLFLQGGARGQFAMAPFNFLKAGEVAQYVITGVWAQGALEEARHFGETAILASGEAAGFRALPSLADAVLPYGTAYVHTTSNNTIYGTQWPALPDFGDVPHVSDMSSDILSRPVDVSRFGLIYAGAQKNAGPAGVTLAFVDRAWMEAARTDVPAIWRYATHAKKGSMYNTPPVFAIHVVGLVARWVEEQGGVPEMARRNEAKAGAIYEAIDGSGGFYAGVVTDPAHRSRMNVTFRIRDPELEPRFVAEASAAGLSGLKGHRHAGGLRASIYNAMPQAGVDRLVAFMDAFRKQHA